MKTRLLFLLIVLHVYAFQKLSGQDSLPVKSGSDSIKKILIINSFDAMSIDARTNKKELFRELADSLKQLLAEQLLAGTEVVIIPELIHQKTNPDSVIYSLLEKNNASKAIVIKTIDAYFNQTDVEVVKESDGKKRTGFYDICSSVTYVLYSRQIKMKESETKNCEFFTQRNVVSGLLAAGPDIVGKDKHAFKIIAANARRYLAEISVRLYQD